MRGALLPLLILLAACGHERSREQLEDRITELEEENDTLKRELQDVQDQLEERTKKAAEAAASTETARRAEANARARAARVQTEEWRGDTPTATYTAEKTAQDAATTAADALQALEQPE